MSPWRPRENKTHPTARQMSVAAIGSALAAGFMTIGYYLQLLEFFWYFMASLCIMVILIRCNIRAALLAFAASALLSLLLCSLNFFFILPFVIYMGPHPIANAAMKKYHLNVFIGHAIKAIWFCAAVLTMILFTNLFFFIDLYASPLTIPLTVAICVPIYGLYDFSIRMVMHRLARHLSRIPNIPRI